MEPVTLPRSRLYYITVQEMNFTVTETLRASRVEKWIRAVKQRFLDATPTKCVGDKGIDNRARQLSTPEAR
jgi:hypothetical protein